MENSPWSMMDGGSAASSSSGGSYLRFPSQAGASPDSDHGKSRLRRHKLQHGRQGGAVGGRRSLLLKDQSLEGQEGQSSHPGDLLLPQHLSDSRAGLVPHPFPGSVL